MKEVHKGISKLITSLANLIAIICCTLLFTEWVFPVPTSKAFAWGIDIDFPPIHIPPPPRPSPVDTLKVCNDYSASIEFGFAVDASRDSFNRLQRTAEGYWNVEPNKCASLNIGTTSGTIYVFARKQNNGWAKGYVWGGEYNVCARDFSPFGLTAPTDCGGSMLSDRTHVSAKKLTRSGRNYTWRINEENMSSTVANICNRSTDSVKLSFADMRMNGPHQLWWTTSEQTLEPQKCMRKVLTSGMPTRLMSGNESDATLEGNMYLWARSIDGKKHWSGNHRHCITYQNQKVIGITEPDIHAKCDGDDELKAPFKRYQLSQQSRISHFEITDDTATPLMSHLLICNESQFTTRSFISHNSHNSWQTRGRYQLDPGSCSRIDIPAGRSPGGKIRLAYEGSLYHASESTEKQRVWTSADKTFCVSTTKASFNYQDHDCSEPGDFTYHLQKIDIKPGFNKLTLNEGNAKKSRDIKLCNDTNIEISVARLGLNAYPEVSYRKGWFNIKANKCIINRLWKTANIPSDYDYHYSALGLDNVWATWGNTHPTLCAKFPNSFTVQNPQIPECDKLNEIEIETFRVPRKEGESTLRFTRLNYNNLTTAELCNETDVQISFGLAYELKRDLVGSPGTKGVFTFSNTLPPQSCENFGLFRYNLFPTESKVWLYAKSTDPKRPLQWSGNSSLCLGETPMGGSQNIPCKLGEVRDFKYVGVVKKSTKQTFKITPQGADPRIFSTCNDSDTQLDIFVAHMDAGSLVSQGTLGLRAGMCTEIILKDKDGYPVSGDIYYAARDATGNVYRSEDLYQCLDQLGQVINIPKNQCSTSGFFWKPIKTTDTGDKLICVNKDGKRLHKPVDQCRGEDEFIVSMIRQTLPEGNHIGIQVTEDDILEDVAVKVCNDYPKPIKIASAQFTENTLISRGWTTVAASSCVLRTFSTGTGEPYNGTAYVTANDGFRNLSDGPILLCIRDDQNFEFSPADGGDCNNQLMAEQPMTAVHIPPDTKSGQVVATVRFGEDGNE